MAERRDRIDYYDPHTWKRLELAVPPCKGVNHADWSADGRWFLVTCEFSGQLLKVDTATRRRPRRARPARRARCPRTCG